MAKDIFCNEFDTQVWPKQKEADMLLSLVCNECMIPSKYSNTLH
jgi:hypothetical protein